MSQGWSDADDSELPQLIQQFQAIEKKLRTLIPNDVDAVIGPSGQSFLLQDAQRQLLERDR